jgi:hypothetical protein
MPASIRRWLKISALVSYKSAVCRLEEGKHHVYTSANGVSIQQTTFETNVLGLPVRFDHQKAANEESSVRVGSDQRSCRSEALRMFR